MSAQVIPIDSSRTHAPEVIDRTPPHDLASEAAVLSAVLIDAAAFDKVKHLHPDHFYSEAHRRIFEAAKALSIESKPIDVVLVATWLRDHERLGQAGGVAYLTEMCNAAPAVANVAAYADVVIEKWRARQMILIGHRISAQGYAGVEPGATIAAALEGLESLTAAPNVVAMLDGAAIAAPLGELDYLVAGLGLVGGGGAPHLKAGFGFSGKTVAVQSLELSLAAGLPVWGTYPARKRRVLHVDMEQGDRLTRRRYQRLAKAMGIDLASLGDALTVLVMPGLSLRAADAPRWKELMVGRDLIVVDSLRAATGGQDENDSSIRDGLDMMGKLSEETGCRALVIHHSRKPSADDPGDARYAIRGSGAIFDAADAVFVFSAAKDEPIHVANPKARSHGEPVPDFALSISDVEVDGDARAGLKVQVHGAELVAERREARHDAAAKAQTARDVERVREALVRQPGASTTELRGLTRLSGDRLAAALLELGGEVEVRQETFGRTRVNRHYRRSTS